MDLEDQDFVWGPWGQGPWSVRLWQQLFLLKAYGSWNIGQKVLQKTGTATHKVHTFWRRSQAASDILRTEPGSLGHLWGWTQAASDTFQDRYSKTQLFYFIWHNIQNSSYLLTVMEIILRKTLLKAVHSLSWLPRLKDWHISLETDYNLTPTYWRRHWFSL